MDLKKIIQERNINRDALNSAKYEERQTKEYLEKYSNFCKHHTNVVVPIELKLGKPSTRVVYSICGYSEKHGYFRNKHETVDLLDDAIEIFQNLKKDNSWGIPTIIVKVTFYRSETLGIYDFDNNNADDLGFSQKQEVVKKSKCGAKTDSWDLILSGFEDNYTY